MRGLLRSLKSRDSFSMKLYDLGRAEIVSVPTQTLAGDKIKIRENVCEIPAEFCTALSSTGYTGKNMQNDTDVLVSEKVKRDIGYTCSGDKYSKQTIFSMKSTFLEELQT